MKRLWAAAAFVVIVIAICSVGIYFVNDYAKGTVRRLEEAKTAVASGDMEKAVKVSEDAEKYWQTAEEILSLFVSHNEISEIGVSISKLAPLIQNGDVAMFMAELNSARVQIIHVAKIESPIDIN